MTSRQSNVIIPSVSFTCRSDGKDVDPVSNFVRPSLGKWQGVCGLYRSFIEARIQQICVLNGQYETKEDCDERNWWGSRVWLQLWLPLALWEWRACLWPSVLCIRAVSWNDTLWEVPSSRSLSSVLPPRSRARSRFVTFSWTGSRGCMTSSSTPRVIPFHRRVLNDSW